jgi:pyrimidine operon attenuation protein/uracil phosphoribosyltransferase
MDETKNNTVPENWKLVLDDKVISRSISRISYEILERNRDLGRLAIVGIRTYGEFLAQRVRARIEEIEGASVDMGVIDITLYRDDLSQSRAQPTLKGTDLPFSISGARIILVDDILFTGRTVRAALDAIIDFGRPRCVELAVLADRGHRELPIRADYVGKNIPTRRSDFMRLRLKEHGFTDGLYIVEGGRESKRK